MSKPVYTFTTVSNINCSHRTVLSCGLLHHIFCILPVKKLYQMEWSNQRYVRHVQQWKYF